MIIRYTIDLTRGELYLIRDALSESDEEDVKEALAIVEEALYDKTSPTKEE